jgi:hypothetical protein
MSGQRRAARVGRMNRVETSKQVKASRHTIGIFFSSQSAALGPAACTFAFAHRGFRERRRRSGLNSRTFTNTRCGDRTLAGCYSRPQVQVNSSAKCKRGFPLDARTPRAATHFFAVTTRESHRSGGTGRRVPTGREPPRTFDSAASADEGVSAGSTGVDTTSRVRGHTAPAGSRYA